MRQDFETLSKPSSEADLDCFQQTYFSLVCFCQRSACSFSGSSLHATVNFNEVNSYPGSKVEMNETLYFQAAEIATEPSFGKYRCQGGLVKWCWVSKGAEKQTTVFLSISR